MEESEFEDVLDDWFIESLKTYKDLHVYQLEHPTQVIEWTSGKTVCVAGCRPSKNEILELRLPLKLFADENKGLCAERDFKVVHGGFTDVPVHCLRHIPGTRCLVSSDGVNADLQVWDLGGDDCDVIQRTGSISGRRRSHTEGGTRIAAPPTSVPQILHGSQSCNIRLSQLTSGQTLYDLECDSADPLSSLVFLSDEVFFAGCSNGNIYIADTRTPAAPQLSPPPASLGESALWWTADASAGPDVSSSRVIRLSSSGEAMVSDLRKPQDAVSRARLDVGTRVCSLDDVSLSWSPVLNDCFAVSGFSGNVLVFDSSLWGAELQDARPLFEHRGHTVSSSSRPDVSALVSSHVWHPERARTLLSAASDGSVHVWDWVDRLASDGAT